MKKDHEEEDKEFEDSRRSAAADTRDQGGRGRGRGGYKGGRGNDSGYSRRGRGVQRNYGPVNEFDGADDDDDQAYAPPTRVRNKKQKKEDLVANDENFPSLGDQ